MPKSRLYLCRMCGKPIPVKRDMIIGFGDAPDKYVGTYRYTGYGAFCTLLRQTKFDAPVIMDPDGWDRRNFRFSFYQECVTFSEFMQRLQESTTGLSGLRLAAAYENREDEVWPYPKFECVYLQKDYLQEV